MSEETQFIGESTRLIHGGPSKDPYTGSSSIPIYQASTFDQEDPKNPGPWDYGRSGNPTRDALERTFASLERASTGLAFASGVAAISSTLLLLEPKAHVVAAEDIYGGTYRLLSGLFARWGLQVSWVDATNTDALSAAIRSDTRALIVESPSNPLLKITDLRKVAQLAKERGVLSIIDNTFMTPWLQRPLEMGFDISVHSATKFLGGHSDVVAGLAAVREASLGKKLKTIQNAFGAIAGPQDSWLTLRGIRTLGVRMDAQQQSAQVLAEWFAKQPGVEAVHYPGLATHPGSKLHASQALGAGAVLSIDLGETVDTHAFLRSLRLPLTAVSLGGVETIVSYPTTMSHAAMPSEERARRGIGRGLLRVSVGLEAVADLQEDFAQALAQIKKKNK